MSPDCNYVIVIANDDHLDPQDVDDDDHHYNGEIETLRTASDAEVTDLSVTTSYNLDSALQCESWD